MQTSKLKTLLAQGGPLEPARAVNVVRQIAAAIDDAHAHQTLHRVVTPATILIARSPSGDDAAYLAESGAAAPSADRTRQLVTNTEATYRADIHALTAVLYECLTGHPPNPGTPQDVPAQFIDVISRGLSDNPDDRYRSAADLAAAAQAALEPTPPPAPSRAATRTIQLPPPPAASPQDPPPPIPVTTNQPPWDPDYGRSPTVSYPHARSVPMQMSRQWSRHLGPASAILVIIVAATVAAFAIPRLVGHNTSSTTAVKSTPTLDSVRHTYTPPGIALPFPGLDRLKSAGVDGAGNVYVLASELAGDANPFDMTRSKVFKLAPGASAATTVDIPGVDFRIPSDMAVDSAGSIYISDHSQVWKLEVGATTPIRLPFRGFVNIDAVAFDSAGNAYAAGPLTGENALNLKYGVKKLSPGDTRPTDLPFADLFMPKSIAVDKVGNIYVGAQIKGSGKGRMLKLAAGTSSPTVLSFPDLKDPVQIAVDTSGDVFVADDFSKGLFELTADAAAAIKLPIDARLTAVTVDSAGNLYLGAMAVKDQQERLVKPGQVLKLPPDK